MQIGFLRASRKLNNQITNVCARNIFDLWDIAGLDFNVRKAQTKPSLS